MAMRAYKNPAMEELKNQLVRFAPAEKRLEQLDRAEKLLTEVVAEKQYPYQYVCYRITQYRSDAYPSLILDGASLEHDLALFIQDLAETVPAVPVEEFPEPVLTLDQISRDLNVSTKTLSRWRNLGLISRRIICGGRHRVGVRRSVLNRFLEQHREQVQRSSKFSQLSDREKMEILSRARRMARYAPDQFTEICRRIARKLGRSVETVRYTIKQHDQENPQSAIFPQLHPRLDEQAKLSIYNSYCRGVSLNALARRFNRARTTVHRIINEVRARNLVREEFKYIPHKSFEDPSKVSEILGPMPGQEEYEAARAKAAANMPKDLPPELAPLYKVPLLTREQEAHLFRKMNFLKHEAEKLRRSIDPARARSSDLDRLEELNREILEIRDLLVSANLRLVVSIVKQHAGASGNFYELFSDGNMSLLRAVEKFDFSRGNKFSTYATWAIRKNFARSIPTEKTHRERFMTGYEEVLETRPDSRSNEHEDVASAQRAEDQVKLLLGQLPERERQVLEMRMGLNNKPAMTLAMIGQTMGITKERVRQIEKNAMNRLRQMVQEDSLEV
jgi:RNA polymerase sigma factor (sigma-70 family)